MRLTGLHIYPVKSCAGRTLEQAEVQPRGLAHDRRWMVIDADGQFVTGRSAPHLVLLQAEPTAHGLRLSAPELPDLDVPFPQADTATRLPVTVWRSQVQALLADEATNAWLSQLLKREVRLVYMDAAAQRPVNPSYGQPGDEVSFADGYPLLIISEESLTGLNARIVGEPVSMLRFRPNLVIAGASLPHDEDGWKRIRIGEVEFIATKPCERCVFTTIIPETAAGDPRGQPLRELARYRRHNTVANNGGSNGVIFGMNLIARGTGTLHLGDALTVLERF